MIWTGNQWSWVSFTASWSGLWWFLTALKYALTCSTFCLVCIGGRSSMNLMVSMGVSWVVPSMTRIASFCTLSSLNRFVCAIVVRRSLQDWHTLFQLQCCCFHMLYVGQHSVKVDPWISQMTCSFNHSCSKCDCWQWFVCCSVVKRAPQCLCLVSIDKRSGVITPLGCTIELLHCFVCLLGVLWCFVYEPVICQCENLAGSILVQLCQAFGVDIKEHRLSSSSR